MKIPHSKFQILLTPLALFFLCSVLCAKAQAASFDLSLSPQIFQIELTPPAVASAKQTITLENNSDDPLPLKIQFMPFRPQGDNGEITYLKPQQSIGNDPTLLDKISISQDTKPIDSLILPPKTKKQLDLTVNIPKDEPPGDYYFSILFLSDNNQAGVQPLTAQTNGEGLNPKNQQGVSPTVSQGSSSTAVGGVVMNVLLSIGPKTKTTGSIEEFSTPFFQPEGPVSFKVKIKNTSSHFIYPQAQIVITNMFGQKIGKIDLLPVNILSNSSRSLPSKEQFVFNAQAQQCRDQGEKCQESADHNAKLLALSSTPKAIWPEVFLLGPYKATLTVAFSDQGPLYVRSLTFIGVPVYIITGFLICILLILAIKVRLTRRTLTKS